MKDGEGELVVVGEEDHEAVAGGVVKLVPLGRGLGGEEEWVVEREWDGAV